MTNVSTDRDGKSPLTRNGKILVMDDDELLTLIIARMLTGLGYTAKAVNDGETAIDLYNKERDSGQPFDAVILDLKVPGGMGGMETLRRLRDIDGNVGAVISSGASWEEVMQDYRSYGFLAALPKPFVLEDLAEAVHTAILR